MLKALAAVAAVVAARYLGARLTGLLVGLAVLAYAYGGAVRPKPRPSYPEAAACTSHSPEDGALAEGMLVEFAAAYQRTFGPEGCRPENLDDLAWFRQRALRSLNAAKLRMPQDAAAVKRAEAAIDRIDKSTMAHVEDAGRRCGVGARHPGPVQDLYYSQWYRAANDSL